MKSALVLASICLVFVSRIAAAGPCDSHWEGEKLEAIAISNHGIGQIPLLDGKRVVVFSIPSSNVLAIKEAKEKIGTQIGRSPRWILCNDREPNAFAFPDGNLMGLTIGMSELIGSDKSMAAMVIGHEYAHHVKDHGSSTKVRKWITTFLGALIGGFLDIKLQQSYGAGVAGIGNDIGDAAGEMVSMKFSRDQEREADQLGFEYLVNSGFDPEGSVRLANALQRRYTSGGYFFDSHPGWDERAEIFRDLIAKKNSVNEQVRSKSEYVEQSASLTNPAELEALLKEGSVEQIYTRGAQLYDSGQRSQGLPLILEAVSREYPQALLYLGRLYETSGSGAPYDPVEAYKLYSRAVGKKNVEAMVALGVLLTTEKSGIVKDDLKAVNLFQMAAKQNSAAAYFYLGYMNEYGRGISKNVRKAIENYVKAAVLGDGEANYVLGMHYENGTAGVTKDSYKALQHYTKAANLGHEGARKKVQRM